MDTALMVAELTRDESCRLVAYDDATGAPIKPGTTVKGHCTIGVGRALDARGISPAEAQYLLSNDIAAFTLGLQQAYTWFNGLDDVRQRCLINMAFNLGLGGLATFRSMLGCVAAQDYDGAAGAMEASVWYTQVGARAHRLTLAMRSGIAQ